jgi:hypothetical protein
LRCGRRNTLYRSRSCGRFWHWSRTRGCNVLFRLQVETRQTAHPVRMFDSTECGHMFPWPGERASRITRSAIPEAVSRATSISRQMSPALRPRVARPASLGPAMRTAGTIDRCRDDFRHSAQDVDALVRRAERCAACQDIEHEFQPRSRWAVHGRSLPRPKDKCESSCDISHNRTSRSAICAPVSSLAGGQRTFLLRVGLESPRQRLVALDAHAAARRRDISFTLAT